MPVASGTVQHGSVMEKRLRLQGNNTGPVADLADAAAAVASQRLNPVIDRTFPMDQAAAAYKHVARGGHGFFGVKETFRCLLAGHLLSLRPVDGHMR